MTTRIFDSEDLERIKMALQRIEELRPELERAKTAGMDVAGAEARLNEQESRLRAILQAFFPGQ